MRGPLLYNGLRVLFNVQRRRALKTVLKEEVSERSRLRFLYKQKLTLSGVQSSIMDFSY